MKKCVFVIGPESSGSKFVARIVAHVTGVADFDDWDGTAWCDHGQNKVCHRSLPYGSPPCFPDVGAWISDNKADYDIAFVLTTRDVTLSEYSRLQRFDKSASQISTESEHARTIMTAVMRGSLPHLVWSYESFMFLGEAYLQDLYAFLRVNSDFVPEIADGNRNRIEALHSDKGYSDSIPGLGSALLRRLRGR